MVATIHPQVFVTDMGVKYVKDPGVILLAETRLVIPQSRRLKVLDQFLVPMDEEWGEYFDDVNDITAAGIPLSSPERLVKFAGQLCYHSFGKKRTRNADAKRYFGNVLEQGHFSLTEHANFTFLIFGVSRAFSHELVRHRIASYSQVSQRYVDDSHLRFVAGPEYGYPKLVKEFEWWINACVEQYHERQGILEAIQAEGFPLLQAASKTDRRKKIQQAARRCLPNETETQLVVTMNASSWRHFLTMRGNTHAELEIRKVAALVGEILAAEYPMLFQDVVVGVGDDTWPIVDVAHRKV